MRVSTYVESALYDPVDGFYMVGGRAGGVRGDFLTAPEIGPLFGAVLARALDTWWTDAGRPSPFVVHEWGAGPGTLVRSVLEARPEALTTGALRWVAVEISAAQRDSHPEHPAVLSAAGPPARERPTVVVANELLDNLPFDIYEKSPSGWVEQRVVPRAGAGRRFALEPADAPGPASPELERLARVAPAGATVPWQAAARDWLRDRWQEVAATKPGGRIVVFDYGASTAELATRSGRWLRTHRAHDDSRSWLEAPGTCDITTDVAFDQLQLEHTADLDRSQAEFLGAHGIAELVEQGRTDWEAAAHIGDLAALKGRSRIREAEALLDPGGMGAFRVLEWVREASKDQE